MEGSSYIRVEDGSWESIADPASHYQSGRLTLEWPATGNFESPIRDFEVRQVKELEFQTISGPEEIKAFLDSLEASIRARTNPETKYNFQIGLKDLEFAVAEERARELAVILPMGSIDEAEQALQAGVITPTKFVEEDNTSHQVLELDPTPVG